MRFSLVWIFGFCLLLLLLADPDVGFMLPKEALVRGRLSGSFDSNGLCYFTRTFCDQLGTVCKF